MANYDQNTKADWPFVKGIHQWLHGGFQSQLCGNRSRFTAMTVYVHIVWLGRTIWLLTSVSLKIHKKDISLQWTSPNGYSDENFVKLQPFTSQYAIFTIPSPIFLTPLICNIDAVHFPSTPLEKCILYGTAYCVLCFDNKHQDLPCILHQ